MIAQQKLNNSAFPFEIIQWEPFALQGTSNFLIWFPSWFSPCCPLQPHFFTNFPDVIIIFIFLPQFHAFDHFGHPVMPFQLLSHVFGAFLCLISVLPLGLSLDRTFSRNFFQSLKSIERAPATFPMIAHTIYNIHIVVLHIAQLYTIVGHFLTWYCHWHWESTKAEMLPSL